METIEIDGLAFAPSRIGLSTCAIGAPSWARREANEAVNTIRHAIDEDITFLESSPLYGFGRAEELIGRALGTGGRRQRVILATKCGPYWHEGRIVRSLRPESISRQLADSLRRLDTEYIDLYEVEGPDPEVPIGEVGQALRELLEQGTIHAIGASGLSLEQLEALQQTAPIQLLRTPFGMLNRACGDERFSYAQDHGIAVLATRVLRGILPCEALRNGTGLPELQLSRDHRRAVIVALERLASERWRQGAVQLAVRWVLEQGRTIALWSANRPEELQAAIDATGWRIHRALMSEIERLIGTATSQSIEREPSPIIHGANRESPFTSATA